MQFSVDEIHGALKAIAKRRAALDVEEACWIRRALVGQVWREFGMVSILDYLEREVGYAPRTAADRVRVAQELGDLPQIESALGAGLIAYSAAREITRVAVRETQGEWLARIENCNLREIEQAVSGREKGDRPDDPPKPHLVKRRISFEVEPQTFARYRQACAQIRGDAGRRLEDSEVFAVMIEAALERTSKIGAAVRGVAIVVTDRDDASNVEMFAEAIGGPGVGADDVGVEGIDRAVGCRAGERGVESGGEERTVVHVGTPVGGRGVGVAAGAPARSRGVMKAPIVRHQIAVVVCEVCRAAAVRSTGSDLPISEAAFELARCDAIELGSLEGERPARRRHTIPPAIRDFVFARDKYRCRVPGCRSTFALDIHHMIHQHAGGDHDPDYLIVACGSCHDAHHTGRIHISGNAHDVRVGRPGLEAASKRAHVGDPVRDEIAAERDAVMADARAALQQSGYPSTVARAAVVDAIETGAEALEAVIRAALQSPHARLRSAKTTAGAARPRDDRRRAPAG